jgi:MATE family multidrug resistance protein
MLGMALALLLTQDRYKPMQLFSHWQSPQPKALAHMLRLGVPAGLSYLVEVTSFTLMALYIARLGAVSSAAHQIAANLTAVLYMMPLSLAIATSARVGYWRGAGHADRAERAVKTGFSISVPLGLAFALLLLLGASWLSGLYTQDAQVRQLATGLLMWVGVYHFADGVQCMTGFILRCYRVTLAPFVLYAVILWAFGLMGGYWLCYRGVPGLPSVGAMQSPLAFWLAATAALYLVAGCLLWLLRRTLRRHRGTAGLAEGL